MIPRADNIVFNRPDTSERKSAGGVIIPENSKSTEETALVGEALFVGEGQYYNGEFAETQTQRGDKFLYFERHATPFTYQGNKYSIIPEGNIIAILTKEDQ